MSGDVVNYIIKPATARLSLDYVQSAVSGDVSLDWCRCGNMQVRRWQQVQPLGNPGGVRGESSGWHRQRLSSQEWGQEHAGEALAANAAPW